MACQTPGVPTAQPPQRRTGGRSARVREAVLGAALEQLLAHGYDGLRIPEVARAAGVAETTVYRRWATKADLAADALGELATTENPVPDTGTLAGDLDALLTQILDLLRRPEVARIVRTAAAIGREGDDAEARTDYWRTRFAGASVIVERAVARGELAADTDPEALVELLVAPAYLRLLLTGRPLDDALVSSSVARVLAAYRLA